MYLALSMLTDSAIPSPTLSRKWRAVWSDGDYTDFGHYHEEDFTVHKDEERRNRHLAKVLDREIWSYPKYAATLERWLLWGEKPSIAANLPAFKKHFHLH